MSISTKKKEEEEREKKTPNNFSFANAWILKQ